MEIGIYITANIIYLVQELYLGDRIHVGSFTLLERWVVTALSVGRHFPGVLWPLAGDVWRVSCSFIALALDIHVFCLRAEAEAPILHATKRFEECARKLTFQVGGGGGQGVLVWLCLCREFILQNLGKFEWVRSQKWLSAWQCKDWHGLHESSYHYFKVYAGTCNLKSTEGFKPWILVRCSCN